MTIIKSVDLTGTIISPQFSGDSFAWTEKLNAVSSTNLHWMEIRWWSVAVRKVPSTLAKARFALDGRLLTNPTSDPSWPRHRDAPSVGILGLLHSNTRLPSRGVQRECCLRTQHSPLCARVLIPSNRDKQSLAKMTLSRSGGY